MRWKFPPLAALGLLMATATAIHAAPADITRKPDVTLSVCNDGGHSACVTRVVGDFNDDQVDDLLIEKMSTAEFLNGVVDQNLPRQFEVYLGPFKPDASGRWQSRPVTTIQLRSDQLRAPVALADVNGDGFNDLAFGASRLEGFYEMQRIAVVFGSQTWSAQALYDLGRAEKGSLVIERKKWIRGENAPFSPNSSVTPAFADLNADGLLDIVLGADPIAAAKLDEAKIHATAAVSEIAVMLGGGAVAGKVVAFRDDLVLRELGACGQGLAGVADVSGDGVPDILARRCMGDGLPDQLRVTAGGNDLARTVAMQNFASPVRLPALDKIVRGQMHTAGLPGAEYATDGVDGGESPNVPPPSEPGRGYLPAGEPPTPFFPSPLFVEDVNDDGVRDIVLGFGDNTHIWLGGADIAARVAEMRTDRVFVHAGYGRLVATQSWKPIDLNGDGKRDLMLTGSASNATSNRCPANARCAPATMPPGGPGSTGGADVKGGGLGSMRFYQRDWSQMDVLDVEQDAPEAMWNSESLAPWGMGDFNDDGVTDLLLDAATPGISSAAGVANGSSLSIAFGPFN